MAISTISGGNYYGGALARHGNGTLYFIHNGGTGFTMYSDVDGSPTLEDTETYTAAHGAGSSIWLDMEIDGDNVIHVVSQAPSGTDYIIHGTFDTVTNTFNSDWVEVIAYAEDMSGDLAKRSAGCNMAVAANGDIHIVGTIVAKVKGVPTYRIIHNFYNGTSWAGETIVNTLDNHAWKPRISAYGSDGNEMMAGYYQSIYAYYRPWTSGGGWGTENSYTNQDFPWDTLDICVDEDGANHYMAYVVDTANQDVEVNGVDTLANPNIGQPEVAIGWQGGVQYLYVAASAGGIQLWVNSGSGWSLSGTIESGEYRWIATHSPLNFKNDRVDISYAGFNFTSGNIHIGRTRGGRRTVIGHV